MGSRGFQGESVNSSMNNRVAVSGKVWVVYEGDRSVELVEDGDIKRGFLLEA